MTTKSSRFPTRAWAPLLASLLLVACAGHSASTATPGTTAPPVQRLAIDTRVDELERRTFRLFWDTANAKNGLVPDRYPTPSPASIAAVGFGLSAYPVGVERGYITRADARERVLATLRFFRDAPQGAAAAGMTGHHGFYYHFLDMQTGVRSGPGVELSTVDTALFIGGVLVCEGYFDGADADEREIREIADALYRRVDWKWASTPEGAVTLGWTPEGGFHRMHWRGYNEAMLIYLLGLGSPTFPLADGAWRQWTSGYDRSWATAYGQSFLTFPPLFGHQFSHIWVDFRGVRDDFMREHDLDYFENSRRATYAQQAYAIANPMHWKAYGARLFGVSAADGPAKLTVPDGPAPRVFRRYAARGMGGASNYDDGTLSPSALASSVAFAPEIVLPALDELFNRYGAYVFSTYGFLDAFDPSFDYDVPVPVGVRIKGVGWIDGDYLGIDSGSTIAMLENYRSELIWRVMRRSPYLRRGLERAGFKGGWLDLPP